MKVPKYSEITREDIIRAIDIYNNSDSKAKLKNYILVYEGNDYPSKEIIRIAYNLKNNANITSNDLSGGKQWISFYEDRGFEIKVLNKEDTVDNTKNEKQQTVKNETAWDRLLELRKKIESEKFINEGMSNKDENNDREPIKVGCYLQTPELVKDGFLNGALLDTLKNYECDIIVFPEFTEYDPFKLKANTSDVFNTSDLKELYDIVLALSQKLDKAIMICNQDKNGVIFSIYANYGATGNETKEKVYVKCSFDETSLMYKKKNFSSYLLYLSEFDLINYRGYKIGMTICADCNYRLYSAMYKKTDIILNGTGGLVIHKKWYIHNKARAIENNSFVFTTMGPGNKKGERNINCVFGFDKKGNLLKNIEHIFSSDNGGLYVYDVKNSITETVSDYYNLTIQNDYDYSFDLNTYSSSSTIKGSSPYGTLYLNKDNIIICQINDKNIFDNKNTLSLLYEAACLKKSLKAKTVIVINKWDINDKNVDVISIKYILMSLSISGFCVTVFCGKENFCFQPSNRSKEVLQKQIFGGIIKIKLNFASFNLFAKKSKEIKNSKVLISML